MDGELFSNVLLGRRTKMDGSGVFKQGVHAATRALPHAGAAGVEPVGDGLPISQFGVAVFGFHQREGGGFAEVVTLAFHHVPDCLDIQRIVTDLDAAHGKMAPHMSLSISRDSGEATMIEPSMPTERLIMSAPAWAARAML